MPGNRLIADALLPVALLLLAAPAAACIPPTPGSPEQPKPDREELIRAMASASTNIVSGIVVGERDGRARFRIERVYKGRLRAGKILDAGEGWGLIRPMCADMPPALSPRGTRGIVFFDDEPRLNYIYEADLERAFAMGLLQRPPQRSRR